MRRRDQRLLIIVIAGAMLSLAVALTLVGLKDSVVYFVAPSEIAEKAHAGQTVRLGGLVVQGSLKREATGVAFAVTDGHAQTEVRYDGVLPDLFREGQGVIAEGVYQPGQPLIASRVLAKHDERYMPREVAEALKRRGEWRGPQ
ncbi:MAG: cytochrome c maturation protein CcmE [Pseudomonadota bacterium]